MGFVDWWKKSSLAASDAHYALRFDEDDLASIRRGELSGGARRKYAARFEALRARNRALLAGCGLPLAFVGYGGMALFGLFILKSMIDGPARPIVWFLAFMWTVVGAGFAAATIFIAREWLRRRRASAADFADGRVAAADGRVRILVRRSRNGFSIHYFIDEIEFLVPDDAIGWEIHRHFFGGPVIGGPEERLTPESYRFFYLPTSRFLVHFERS